MGYSVNGPIVRDSSLVMAVDAGYNLSYDGRENLANNSTYNATTWTLPAGNATITTGIDAPDGTNTAVRFTGTNTGNALLRVNHPSITPNGTDSYTVSFFARSISGTIASNGLATDWSDGGPSGDYTSSLSLNNWVRISFTAVATAVGRSFVDIISDTSTNRVIDFWGLQVEKSPTVTTYTPTNGSIISRGTTWRDMISGTTFSSVANTAFSTDNGGYFTYSGAASSFVSNSTHPSINITNNLTLEAWVFVSSWNNFGGIITFGTDAAEQYTLVMRSSGAFSFAYNWPGTWYITTSAEQGTSTGRWFHVASTFVDGVVRIYVNGAASGTPIVHPLAALPAVTGSPFLTIGNQHPGGDEMLVGRVAIARIYNRALTPTEISQNFAAHRGRFGL